MDEKLPDLERILKAIQDKDNAYLSTLSSKVKSTLHDMAMAKEVECINNHFVNLLFFPRTALENSLSRAENDILDMKSRIPAYIIVCLRGMFEEFKKAQDESVLRGEDGVSF